MDTVDIPILDPGFKSNPHAWYDHVRETRGPVVRVRLPTGVEAWLAIDHEIARQLLNDIRLSKQSPGSPAHPLFQHLLTMDPPDHTRLRSIAAREFSPQRVRLLRPRVTAIAVDLIDAMARRGEADLIETFALPFPLTVICELLGVPPADEPRIRRWSAQLLAADLDEPARVPDIADELREYLLALARLKRQSPDDRLFTALVSAHDAGELSASELTAMGFLLLVAGHETTVSLIGNGVLALLRHQLEWRRLCANPGLAPAAVEELLRYDSPLEVATARYATAEISVDDVRIGPGEMVFVGLGAANHDARCFHDPARLDIARADASEHVAFGHGIHYCLGASLARLEGEVAFTELAQRCPALTLAIAADELRWKPGLIMRGLERLPVKTGSSIGD